MRRWLAPMLLSSLSSLGSLGCSVVPELAVDGGSDESTGDGDAGEAPKLVSDRVPGLRLRDAEQAELDGHLVEIIVHEGYAYTANSLGIVTMRLDDDGGLTLTDNGKQAAGQWTSCTTIALHAASDTIYCAADGPSMGEPRIELYDLSAPLGDPAAPVRREPAVPLGEGSWAVRHLEVVGDTLLSNQFDHGLWTAPIDALGQPGELVRAPIDGNVRFTVAVGERLVSLLADIEGSGTQLRVLERDSFTELARLALDGPPVGISADLDGSPTVVVALASGGLAVVDVSNDAPSVRELIQPPAIVNHGLMQGDLVIAVTLSGAFAYRLGDGDGGSARLFGFGPESSGATARDGNMLHATLHDGELLTSDWTWVQRWTIDPQGESLALDVPRGVYIPPTGPVAWRVRNPGTTTLRAEHWVGPRHLFDVELEPGEVERIELDVIQRATILERDDPSVTLSVRVHDPSVDRSGTPVSTSSLMILQRWPEDPLPPAVGERLDTTVTLADYDKQIFTLPQARRMRLVWYSPDCALMWSEFEDLAWHRRRGETMGGDPIFISPNDVSYGFAQRWGLGAVEFGLYGHQAPPEVDAANAAFGGEDLLGVFIVHQLPGNADVSDYVMDEHGVVESIERMYRGPYSLVDPAPW